LFTLCFHNYLKLIVFGNTILFLTIFSPLYAENLQAVGIWKYFPGNTNYFIVA